MFSYLGFEFSSLLGFWGFFVFLVSFALGLEEEGIQRLVDASFSSGPSFHHIKQHFTTPRVLTPVSPESRLSLPCSEQLTSDLGTGDEPGKVAQLNQGATGFYPQPWPWARAI